MTYILVLLVLLNGSLEGRVVGSYDKERECSVAASAYAKSTPLPSGADGGFLMCVPKESA